MGKPPARLNVKVLPSQYMKKQDKHDPWIGQGMKNSLRKRLQNTFNFSHPMLQ